MNHRVVVTGMAGISPLGNDWLTVRDHLGAYRNAIVHMADWDGYDGLNTRLGAPAAPFELSARYNRKSTRSMGRVALLATRASELALIDAGLLDHPLLTSGRMGVYYEKAAALGNENAKVALKRVECPYVVKDKSGKFVSNLCF